MELTDMQRKVLCALSAYPEYNDRELAELLKSKRSTVTAARYFLEQNHFFCSFLLPDFEKLGASLLAVKYGDYDKFKPISYQKRMQLAPQNIKMEESVFSVSSKYKGFSLFLAKDFHQIKEKIDAWNSLFESIDHTIAIRDVYLPMKMIKSYRFMNTQSYLCSILEMKLPPPLFSKQKAERKRPLSKKEKEVMQAWLKEPASTNEALSHKIKVSRAVVGSIKKRLLNSEMVRKFNLPQWPRLGVNLGVLTYLKSNPKKYQGLKKLETLPQVIFLAGSLYEVILFSVFRDYQEYQKTLLPLTEELKKRKEIIKEPEELLFNLGETAFNFNAAKLTEKLLELPVSQP